MEFKDSSRSIALASLVVWALAVSVPGCGGGTKRDSQTADRTEISASQRAQQAQSFLNAGRISDAMEAIELALQQAPDDPRVRHFSGQIYFRAGRFEEAEAGFLKALELDPYLTDAHNFLGAVYQESGRPAEAEREYRLALEDPAYPTPEKVYLNLGLMFAAQGREDDALQYLRRSVEIDPQNYRAQFEQAVILEKRGKLEQAIRLYIVAQPGYRSNGSFYYRLASAYLKSGQEQDAKENFRRCISVAPGSESSANCADILETLN